MNYSPIIKWSILIPTVPSRLRTVYPDLIDKLLKQIEENNASYFVEVLALFDNKTRILGEKRNDLVRLARGIFSCFIDDDDDIADDYVSSILKEIDEHRDAHCIVFGSDTIFIKCPHYEKNRVVHCEYGVEFPKAKYIDANQWRGKPSHTMVWRSEIMKKHQFTPKNNGEDFDFVYSAYHDIDPNKQIRINKTLYYYRYNSRTTETQH